MVFESASMNARRPIFGLDRKEQRNLPLLDLRGASEVGLGLIPIGLCPVQQAQIAKRLRDGGMFGREGVLSDCERFFVQGFRSRVMTPRQVYRGEVVGGTWRPAGCSGPRIFFRIR